VKPALGGTRRPLGTGQMLPAARPDAVWILSGSGQGVMVTGTGRRIAGPAPLLADLRGSSLYANLSGLAVSGGLVAETDRHAATGYAAPAGLWLWNPLRGPKLRPLARGCAHAIAAHGPLLAWLTCDPNNPVRVRMQPRAISTARTRFSLPTDDVPEVRSCREKPRARRDADGPRRDNAKS